MEGGPPVSGLTGTGAPNHPVLRWLKTIVVSDRAKERRTRCVRWRPGKTCQKSTWPDSWVERSR